MQEPGGEKPPFVLCSDLREREGLHDTARTAIYFVVAGRLLALPGFPHRRVYATRPALGWRWPDTLTFPSMRPSRAVMGRIANGAEELSKPAA